MRNSIGLFAGAALVAAGLALGAAQPAQAQT